MKIPILYQAENILREVRNYFIDFKDTDNEFENKLRKIIKKNYKNHYEDDCRLIPDLNGKFEETKIDMSYIQRSEIKSIARLLRKLDLKGLNETYQMLEDDYSKNLLVQVIAYRILGHTRLKLPLADKNLWLPMIELEKNCKKSEFIETKAWKLNLFDLNPLGYDIKLFLNTEGIFIGLELNQYGYSKNGQDFKVEKGDYVIDGGACYGDTALFFAHDAGKEGRVFSFEFVQDNLDIFNKNLELNPKIKDRIKICKNALWENSKENLFIVENGPATYCTMDEPEKYTQKVRTQSIDDLVASEEILKVDFIKFDIEGAEFEALKGCENTIKQFQPKLAICLYHNLEHFVSLPKYVKKLVPGYKLYIDHHTMSDWETVMYAVPPKKKD